MKKISLLTFLIVFILSCTTPKSATDESEPVGIPQKTVNPNTPYNYKNGYKYFEVLPALSIRNNDTISINELRFYAAQSAMYTQKVMFDKFGFWSNEIKPKNKTTIILIWKNIKLFESKPDLYTITAGGVESWEEMYTSVSVVDSKNNDCLSKKSKVRDAIIRFFSNGIKNLNDDKNFYTLYHKAKEKYRN